MHPPLGFHDPHHLDYVCLLNKSLYGLNQGLEHGANVVMIMSPPLASTLAHHTTP